MYELVEWPDVQELMEEDWFQDEAILNHESSSSFFIPVNRLYLLGDKINMLFQEIDSLYNTYMSEYMLRQKTESTSTLWEEKMLANITKEQFIEFLRYNMKFRELWGTYN